MPTGRAAASDSGRPGSLSRQAEARSQGQHHDDALSMIEPSGALGLEPSWETSRWYVWKMEPIVGIHMAREECGGAVDGRRGRRLEQGPYADGIAWRTQPRQRAREEERVGGGARIEVQGAVPAPGPRLMKWRRVAERGNGVA